MKYAERLRGEILNAIERGGFEYLKYFPHSKRAKLFGFVPSDVTIGKLLDDYMAIASKNLSPSTVARYEAVIQCAPCAGMAGC